MEIKIDETRLSAEQLATLNQIIAEANKSKRWVPKCDETYYYVESDSNVDHDVWVDSEVDRKTLKMGNCFRTEAEAQFAADKALCIAELQNYADEHDKLDWDNLGHSKYFIMYYHQDGSLAYGSGSFLQAQGAIYFSSESICKSAIAAIGESRIKKYLFGVSDD